MAFDLSTGAHTWIFSGIGVAAISIIVGIILNNKKGDISPSQNVTQTINISTDKSSNNAEFCSTSSLKTLKLTKKILFIDDDTKFKIVTILKNSGWVNTTIIKDIKSLDHIDIVNTDIFFVDVNGVGKLLGFKDEGLGLAHALKQKYPHKKVVIYSIDKTGDRFHEALRKADDFISKDAEPYQFQKIVEDLSRKD